MVQHSGIGVVLGNLLDRWRQSPPAAHVCLLGDPALLERWRSPAVSVLRWTPGIYSPSAALLPPGLPKGTCAWYSPHYATCLRPGVPLVCHVQDVLHVTHPTKPGMLPYARLYFAALRRSAAFVLTSTRHVKVQLQTLLRFPAERVLISGLGPGFAASLAEGRPAPEGLAAGSYLLGVGILKSHKNWEFLLRRLAVLGDSVPPLVAAGLGPQAEELRALAARCGYGRLRVLGPLPAESLAGLFAGAAALTYPSLAEGFGLPLIEAMQLGRPVVAADRSPMKEIVGDGGWLFDPDQPESFDRALREALGSNGARADAARRRAGAFTWERTASVTEEALRRAVSPHELGA